jgi:hypothetical protein
MKSILSLLYFLSFTYCFSQELLSSKLLPCNETIGQDLYNRRIISQKLSHDTLFLEVGFVHNCAAILKSELKVNNNSLFLNLENVSEAYEACNCCYTMLFTIIDVPNSSYKLFIDSTEYKLSKSKYIDFPPREISKKLLKNETNAEGKKIGYWKIKTQHGFTISYYGDGSAYNNRSLWKKEYKTKNELVSVSILRIRPDVIESYNAEIDKDFYLKIIAEIENE